MCFYGNGQDHFFTCIAREAYHIDMQYLHLPIEISYQSGGSIAFYARSPTGNIEMIVSSRALTTRK